MKQMYAAYTPEDHQVWQILFGRQMAGLENTATSRFLEGIDKIGFKAAAIPDFEEVNQRLAAITGWQLQAVPGIVADDEFFRLLADKRFPATTWIRKMSQLDYLEEPDMFHDVFAHVPLLTNAPYVGFLQELSKIALQYIDQPLVIDLISRIYWFTIEFGLIMEGGKLKIYGAGILSSAGESRFCLGGAPAVLAYRVKDVLDEPYIKEKFQVKYFVIEDYGCLFDSIAEISGRLAAQAKVLKVAPVTA